MTNGMNIQSVENIDDMEGVPRILDDATRNALLYLQVVDNTNEIEAVLNILDDATRNALEHIDVSAGEDTLKAVDRLYGVVAALEMLKQKARDTIGVLEQMD